jgi:tight adherence protein B
VAAVSGAVPVLLGALAGGLALVAVREAVAATPAAARWLALAVEPLRRAGREGYSPTDVERRRLAAIGAAAMLAAGLLLLGPGSASLLAIGGPAALTAAIGRRRHRYRLAVEHGLPEVATSLADTLAAGRSVRSALSAVAASVDGPPAVEMARLRAELELGVPTRTVLEAWQRRMRSQRVDALAAALLSEQVGGGDLATLLRRFGAAAAERDRADADARSATTQARFTGLLVVAMPVGAGVLAELLEPGFGVGLIADPLAATVLACAAGLQLVGFAAIRRLSRITAP